MTTNWTGPVHPMDEERARLREEVKRLDKYLYHAMSERDTLAAKHAVILEELRAQRLRSDELLSTLETAQTGWRNADASEKASAGKLRACEEELRAVRAELAQARAPSPYWLDQAIDRERRARCKQCATKRCDRCDWARPADRAVLRHLEAERGCSCPRGITGERIASHECPRHGALLRWELADG